MKQSYMKGSLNTFIINKRDEARTLIASSADISHAKDWPGGARLAKAMDVVARLAEMRLSSADLVALFHADANMRAELERNKLDPSNELTAMIWESYGADLSSEPSPEIASENTFREAEEIIIAEEKHRSRLATLPQGMTVGELFDTQYPPPQWIVPDLLVSGLTILAGAPKLGKSWLALALGSAVGAGGAVFGRYRVDRRKAIYFALEDTPRRLKDRLRKIGACHESRLKLFTNWRSGSEGIADLDAYLCEYDETKLVLIDTLARFRGTPQGEDRYSEDYRALAAIKTIADKHDCAIVVIHHIRKMQAEDPLDLVSGSNGLNGAADSTWILSRARGESDASLFITGRDVEEQTLALKFDGACGSWTVIGDAAEYSQTRERRDILEILPFEPEAMPTKEIVAQLGKKASAVSRLLEKLETEGLARRRERGEWSRIAGKYGKSVREDLPQEEERKSFTSLPNLPSDTLSKPLSGFSYQ